MFGTHDLWLFVLSGLLLNITPGPDTLYIVGRSSTQGWHGGAVAALGIGAGTLVHITAAALGLSAILAASATAFTVVKFIGAAYLLYVGVTLIRSAGQIRPSSAAAAVPPVVRPASMRGIFVQGFLTNVLNPKVALFFLAFLPQFVAADASSKPLAFLLLGAIFDFNGTLWNLVVARSAAHLSSTLAPGAAFRRWFSRCVGGLFIFIGLRLALVHEQ
ncbi:MAG TPA: LysE family translocator [Steroidobacteraceae bacterium]|nr:LysE family translocator [Steroidobacteraceae bacterium]